ncbi:MAG: hypothetical protein HY736_03155 [Verrucomicrobia bacterium]|nr:hypothetical protein [Verrucomicrobiota bacterium]
MRPIDPGGPVVIGPGGGAVVLPGGGGIAIPGQGGGGNLPGQGGGGILIPPILGGGTTPIVDARVVGDAGILAGGTGRATVMVPTPTTAAQRNPSTQAAATDASEALYRWTISGGTITSDPAAAAVEFTADVAGSVTLGVTVITDGTSYSASSQVTVLPATAAGAMTVAASAVAGPNITVSASVPAAVNGDRTFRWTVSGDAAIASGQGTATIAFRPGTPGLKEVTCAVNLQNIVTATLRSLVVVAGNGPPVAVTVNGGSGGGTYSGGTHVDLFADAPPAGSVFDQWVGDTAALGTGVFAARLPHVVLTVPATPVTLTATYKAAPAWTPAAAPDLNPQRQTDASGRTVNVSARLLFHIPAAARGLVFLLHDTGGSADEWFGSPEQLLLARDLVAAGYGVAALSSFNRTAGAWAAQATLALNPDALNLVAALDRFARDGAFAPGNPVFLLGMAGGADAAVRFAPLLAAARPAPALKGLVFYCAAGSELLAATSGIPEFFALAGNDTALGAAGAASARANAQLLAGRGIAAAVVSTTTSPVPAGRFRVLAVSEPGLTAADTTAIWTALKNAGLFDANNYLKSIPKLSALKAAIPSAYQGRAPDIAAQLALAYGAPALFSEADARVIDFLDRCVAATPAPEPARPINLSARSSVAYLGDSYTFGFTLAGRDNASVLIRGVGPTLARFGVSPVLAAPRLEVNRGANLLAANEGWDRGGNNAAQITALTAGVGAFPLPPGGLDAAVLLTLPAGSYTATLRGVNGTTGEALMEIYDVSRNNTRLTNLSTLARVDDDGDLVIPGIVLAGTSPRTLLVRAVGPGLTDFGLPASTVLGDPRVSVFNAGRAPVAANNNWTQGSTGTLSAVFATSGAFPLKAANGDAALLNAFSPGAYTIQAGATPVAGAAPAPGLTTGRVLVEVYVVP